MERRRPTQIDDFLAYSLIVFATCAMTLVFASLGLLQDSFGMFIPLVAAVMAIALALSFLLLALCVLAWVDRYRISKDIMELAGDCQTIKESVLVHRPAYLFLSSVDREILLALNQMGGHLLAIEEALYREALVHEKAELVGALAKLLCLGLVRPPDRFPFYRMFLTTRGLDAINVPAVLFVSNLPIRVWEYVIQLKTELSAGNWTAEAISMANALQIMLAERLEETVKSRPLDWEKTKTRFPKKAFTDWVLGDVLGALRSMDAIAVDSFEDKMLSELDFT